MWYTIYFNFRYAIIYKKGYQETSPIQSAVISKVKGVSYTNFSDDEFQPGIPHKEMYNRIWDVADYVVPPDVSICQAKSNA